MNGEYFKDFRKWLLNECSAMQSHGQEYQLMPNPKKQSKASSNNHSPITAFSGTTRTVISMSATGDVLASHGNIPEYSRHLLHAAQEAKRVSGDIAVPGYTDMDSLKHALED